MTPAHTGTAVQPLRRQRRWLYRVIAIALGILAALSIIEVVLRVSPPAQLRIRGGRIALPLKQRTVFRNTTISKVDAEIVQTRNSLGFRGDEPPARFKEALSIIAVGGSTTECYYLSDDRTWPEQLKQRLSPRFDRLWINNAGLDGHSTFGHLKLFDQYLETIHPRCLLFLIGANDVGIDRPVADDEHLRRDWSANSTVAHAYFWAVEHSATAALFDNLRRTAQARRAGLVHQDIGHAQLEWNSEHAIDVPATERDRLLTEHRRRYLPAYRQRLEQLLNRCRRADILPVLVTQPALFGPMIDPATGLDLDRMGIGDWNGSVQWQLLELYNDVTRDVAARRNVPVIDLARTMPKDSRFYYDYYHFTNEGAAAVADLIAAELTPILLRKFPAHAR